MAIPIIRVGIGGWSFAPWRDNFYPEGWPQNRELEYASRQLDTIEINSTFHRSQKAAVFAKWRDEIAWVIVREDYGAIGLRDARSG